MKKKIVMKFGGTSNGSASAIQRIVDILYKYKTAGHEIAVVVSAAEGVTNAFNLSILQSQNAEKGDSKNTLSNIQAHLEKIASELLHTESARYLFSEILASYLAEAHRACSQIKNHTKNQPQLKDQILSIGERIQIHLIAAALKQKGVQSKPIEASELIITNAAFQKATPQQPITDRNIKFRLTPFLKSGVIPVITGFIGATADGMITTLGRGGSDYSAAIITAGLNADELWIWTDVDGVMTTDPDLLPDAQLISEISYQEVFDLTYFGSDVLHPKTILPLLPKGIPVRIKNTFNKNNQGTYVHVLMQNDHAHIKAVTGIENISIISISNHKHEDNGKLIMQIENAFKESHFQVLGVFQDNKKDSTYLAINNVISDTQLAVFERQLAQQMPGKYFPRLQTKPGQTLITAVGCRIQESPELGDKLKLSLKQAGVTMHADAQSLTSHSISFLIEKQDHFKAIQQIHNELLSHSAI